MCERRRRTLSLDTTTSERRCRVLNAASSSSTLSETNYRGNQKSKKNKCHDKGCTDTDNPYWGIGTDAGVEYSTRTKILNTEYLYQ